MTELIFKSKIDYIKLNSIIGFLKAWDIDAEIRTTPAENRERTRRNVIFTDFGLIMPSNYKFNRDEANAR